MDLTGARWIKSTRSGTENCVEVAHVAEAVAVRDSKNPGGPALIFASAEWTMFIEGAKAGEFNLPA